VENNFSASYYDPEQGYMSNQAPRQAEYFDPRGGRSRRSPGSAPVTGMPVPSACSPLSRAPGKEGGTLVAPRS
jgi:hypothetical protein